MDPQTDLPDLVEDLEVNIDELTSTLTPLLPPSSLPKTATSLPLLEKAKLHVLAAYAIESVLFSTLQASGADAKASPVFAELARLKAYFAKIKAAEDYFSALEAKEARARLDVGAAQRFIKHGLSGNERYDEMRRERVRAEKERALEKARRVTNRKFSEGEEEGGRKRRVEGEDADEGSPNKKVKGDDAEQHNDEEDEEEDGDDTSAPAPAPAPPKRGKKSTKPSTTTASNDNTNDNTNDTPAKKKRGRPSKKDKASDTPQKDTPARATRSSAPKTGTGVEEAAAGEGSPAVARGRGKGKGRGKK